MAENLAEEELDETPWSNPAAAAANPTEPTRAELKEMLVDIQISIADILRDQFKLREEVAELRATFQKQQSELTTLRPVVLNLKKQTLELENELEAARRELDEQEEEISQLYSLQDNVEQYSRKNSLEIHGIPESAYSSTEEAVLKLAESLDVLVRPEDIEISHKLKSEGARAIIVKFVSHKVKSSLYKQRTKLRRLTVADIFPGSCIRRNSSAIQRYIYQRKPNFV